MCGPGPEGAVVVVPWCAGVLPVEPLEERGRGDEVPPMLTPMVTAASTTTKAASPASPATHMRC
jgi:hypothetical protein